MDIKFVEGDHVYLTCAYETGEDPDSWYHYIPEGTCGVVVGVEYDLDEVLIEFDTDDVLWLDRNWHGLSKFYD